MTEQLVKNKEEALYHSVPDTKEVAGMYHDPETSFGKKENVETREEKISAVIASIDKIEKQVKAELGAKERVLNFFKRAVGDTIGVGHFFEDIKSKIESYKNRFGSDVEEFTKIDLENMMVEAKKDNYQGALGPAKGIEKKLKLVYIPSDKVNRGVDGTGRV